MTAGKELGKFLAKYESANVRKAKTKLAKVRKLLPGAIEMVYDNYNFLVIGLDLPKSPAWPSISSSYLPTI